MPAIGRLPTHPVAEHLGGATMGHGHEPRRRLPRGAIAQDQPAVGKGRGAGGVETDDSQPGHAPVPRHEHHALAVGAQGGAIGLSPGPQHTQGAPAHLGEGRCHELTLG